MAIKRKAIFTYNATIPTLPPTATPSLGQTVAVPFASGSPYKTAVFPLVNPNPLRPTQVNGFDISTTKLPLPNPIYLNDLNGILNLYSNVISDLCGGTPIQFDLNYIAAQVSAGVPSLNQGYQAGAILFSYTYLAWFQSLQNNNTDDSINTKTKPLNTAAWKQITDVSNNLVQQGRLCGITGSPYGDTASDNSGSPTLYFTPTEQGNLISLYDGISQWITQSFNELSLPVSSFTDAPDAVAGSLSSLGVGQNYTNPSGVTVSSDGLNVYLVNYSNLNEISSYRISGSGTDMVLYGNANYVTGNNPIRIAISRDGNNAYVTCFSDNNIRLYSRSSSDGSLSGIVAQTEIPTGNQPQGIIVSPDGLNVYVAVTNDNNIRLFTRNPNNGQLSAILAETEIQTGQHPNEITISSDGAFVYVTNQVSFTISQYFRNSDTGYLTAIGTDTPVPTGDTPTAIVISPDGLNVYVPNFYANTISQYSRNISTGILLALSPTTVSSGNYPFQITISPDGNNVYVTNASLRGVAGNTISEYSRNLSTGQLTLFDTIGTQTNPAQIAITPNGKNVFVANFDGNSLSYYSRQVPTAPRVSLTTPNSTTNVIVRTDVVLTFSEPVQGVSLNTVIFNTSSGGIQIATGYTQSGNAYTLTFPKPLNSATKYYVRVQSGISSVATGLAVAVNTFNFTTVDITVPTVQLINPPNNATNVILTPLVQIQFNEQVLGVSPTTIIFQVEGATTPIPITISQPSATYVYTLTVPQLTLATKYLVVINSGITSASAARIPLQPIQFNFSTTFPPVLKSDIYVANIAGVLVLAKDQFSDTTTTNRTQVDGRWVNAHTITTSTPNIQSTQGLLVGSIAVYNGVVQSWTGNRSIFNLYNRVALGLLAYQNPPTSNPVPNSWIWQSNNTNFNLQNGNNTAGQGNFYFLIDLLYNQEFTCAYNGGGYFTAAGNQGAAGIALNPTTVIIPLTSFSYGGLSGSAGIVPFNLSYGYQFNNVSTTQFSIGLNWLQKIENGNGYFSDNTGLTATYYG